MTDDPTHTDAPDAGTPSDHGAQVDGAPDHGAPDHGAPDHGAPATADWTAWWENSRGTLVAVVLLATSAAALLFGNLGGLGIWEPWEASEILVAQEYGAQPETAEPAAQANAGGRPVVRVADDANAEAIEAAARQSWVVPTFEGRPVSRPLLKTWLIRLFQADADAVHTEVGALELSSRLAVALGVFFLVLLCFAWIRAHFDTWSALVTAVVLATIPAVYLGAHALSTEVLYAVTSSLAIMAYFQLIYAQRESMAYLWGAALGLGLAACFLEQRFFGLLLPVAVIAGFGVAQMPFEQARAAADDDRIAGLGEWLMAGAALAAAVGTVVVAFVWSQEAPDQMLLLPHLRQWAFVLVPSFVVLAGLVIAHRTRAIRALVGGPGMVALAIAAMTVAAVVSAYADVLPAEAVEGVAYEIPVLGFLLDNHLFGRSLAGEHLHFAMWVRQLGFTLVPWVALVPLGIGYLAWAARLEDDEGRLRDEMLTSAESLKRLLLVWAFVALAVVAVASTFGHYYYPAYLPLAGGVGLMLCDRAFWHHARSRSLLAYALGFIAVTVVLMLGKDLERFPSRLVEAYMSLDREVGLPEDFTFGRLLKALKYGWALLLMTFFFGLVSWAAITWRNLRELPQTIRDWRARRASTAGDAGPAAADSEPPVLQRAREKEAFRQQDGLWPALARLVETPRSFAGVAAVAGLVTAAVLVYGLAPVLSHHLSQRGIFETYQRTADDGEPLYRYQVALDDNSVYLDDIERIAHTREFLEKYESDERIFVVVPRERLAAINYEVRRKYDENVPVLDARSSRLLLLSNKLEEGEEDQNFVADQIVPADQLAQIDHPLHFADGQGNVVRASFDDSLEFVGYDIEGDPMNGEVPTFGWGDKIKLTTYFEVKRRVPSQQEIFLHVDYPGSRIHGDHDPAGGEFPTNYWLPGDVIKDTYELTIDPYSTPGAYTIWMGFYRGSNRMEVTPRQAHDGSNRLRVARIMVEGI